MFRLACRKSIKLPTEKMCFTGKYLFVLYNEHIRTPKNAQIKRRPPRRAKRPCGGGYREAEVVWCKPLFPKKEKKNEKKSEEEHLVCVGVCVYTCVRVRV